MVLSFFLIKTAIFSDNRGATLLNYDYIKSRINWFFFKLTFSSYSGISFLFYNLASLLIGNDCLLKNTGGLFYLKFN